MGNGHPVALNTLRMPGGKLHRAVESSAESAFDAGNSMTIAVVALLAFASKMGQLADFRGRGWGRGDSATAMNQISGGGTAQQDTEAD